MACNAHDSILREFAELAHRFGCQSEEITSILQQEPDFQIVKDFSSQLRPPDHYEYSVHERNELARYICERLSRVRTTRIDTPTPSLATDIANLPKSYRYGRPLESSYKGDCKHMSFENVFGCDNSIPGRCLTFESKYVAIRAFFSPLQLQRAAPHGLHRHHHHTVVAVLPLKFVVVVAHEALGLKL